MAASAAGALRQDSALVHDAALAMQRLVSSERDAHAVPHWGAAMPQREARFEHTASHVGTLALGDSPPHPNNIQARENKKSFFTEPPECAPTWRAHMQVRPREEELHHVNRTLSDSSLRPS
jgi:hypothetical protein